MAAISITMRRPDIGVELSDFVASLSAGRETSAAGL
jgi:hypothetical protein